MACNIHRKHPSESSTVQHRFTLPYPEANERLPEYYEWLISDEAEGEVFWQYGQDEQGVKVILFIGFTHPPTAFAFKMRYL